MTDGTIAWPVKTREMHNHHFDSTIWNDFEFRDDDIVIGAYGKSGTTWVQQIVAQLLFDGAEGVEVAEISPWLDLRVPPKAEKLPAVEAQTHRRFIKTHLPVDALVFSPKARYIYVARDGRDVLICANTERMWHELCAALEISELVKDPRFETNERRHAHRAELTPLLARAFGYSVALGAFLGGALVSESGEAKTITPLLAPVRDLFAAIDTARWAAVRKDPVALLSALSPEELAALAAEGTSLIHGAHHVRRGYENIDRKFQQLGASITRSADPA